jgi:hypothetical protein
MSRLLTALAALTFVAAVLLGGIVPAAAQDGSDSTPPTTEVERPHSIPRPNTGEEPQSATDPGGAAQYAVMGGIVVGVLVIALLVARESRKKKPKPDLPS